MKQEISKAIIANIQKAFEYAGLPVSENSTAACATHLNCFYSCNTDGSVRWVWSARNKHADFLKLYHGKGLKPWLFTIVIQLLFILNLQHLFAKGSFKLYVDLSKNDWANNRWALFTGTIGPNQKMILWKQKGNGESIFYKIALTAKAQLNIKQEAQALQLVAAMPLKNIQFPALLAANLDVITLQDVSKGVTKTNSIAQLPQASLQNWCTPIAHKKIDNTLFWNQKKPIEKYYSDSRIPKAFLNKLNVLINEVNANATIAVAPSHGDCTPWNVWMKNNQLCMIDWELFAEEAPALTDVFHFVYQSNILIGNNDYSIIRKQLNELFAQPQWKAFIEFHELDVVLLEKLYLVNTVSYYLEIYAKQTNWHLQISWLLQTWSDALTYFIKPLSIRKTVLNDVAILLHFKPYAAMKFMEQSFENVSENSDIDICISKENAQHLTTALQNHIYVADVAVQKFSHMYQLHAELTDGSLIHIDCIHRVQRKALQFMNCSEIIEEAIMNNAGIKVASLEHDFTYTWLFYWLNNAPMPIHYQEHFAASGIQNLEKLDNELYIQWSGEIKSHKDAFTFNTGLKNKIEKALKNQLANNTFNHIIHTIQYFMDIVKRLFPKKGCIITFSGVDGAGKSTVIEKVKFMVEKKYRKPVIVIRHRPSVLPILSAWTQGKENAEKKAAATLPRQGNNNSYISSLIRFAYYYADYLFGQIYIQCKYVLRGYIVLYDRYYFDFINDSKRSNITLPKSFTSLWYRFLLKPKYNFFLYASAEEILVRKKELDAATITALTKQYLTLFDKLSVKYKSSEYIPVYNKDLSATLSLIEDTVMLHKPVKSRINQLRAAAM